MNTKLLLLYTWVLSDFADLHYKVSGMYDPTDEGGLFWNDLDVGIQWPIDNPVVTVRDAGYPKLKEHAAIQLPHGPFDNS